MMLADAEHARAAQSGLHRNFVIHATRPAQSNHLHTPFVLRLARERSYVGCFPSSKQDCTLQRFKIIAASITHQPAWRQTFFNMALGQSRPMTARKAMDIDRAIKLRD